MAQNGPMLMPKDNAMFLRLPARTTYSRAEDASDAVVHALGLGLALLAVPVLLALAWRAEADGRALGAVAVYGASLIAMILCSALYNMARPGRWSGLLRRLDHGAIYIKIAGTYTPFVLVSPSPAGWFLAWIWACAAFGAGLRSLAPERLKALAIALYLVMGWSGALAGAMIFETISDGVYRLILAGGLIYTIGFAFYLCARLPFHRTIWHGFVMTASGVFFAAVALHVLSAA